jgi:UDPglucose--hexose-1-phosphate uridylyltransferase
VSERRWDPVLAQWVTTATHRQDRTFLPPADFCPLCPTRPDGIETEIDRADFEIAVFENRFPSLQRDPPEPSVEGTDLSPVAPSAGACEVVVYTPRHDGTLADASLGRLRNLIAVWAHRTLELGARPEVADVFIFENKGKVIGVTLDHPHGQIYAYPTIPTLLEREARSAREHLAGTGRCLWEDLLDQETTDGRRIVAQTRTWVAGVPFAARWPYELQLSPRRHLGWLHELSADEVDDLARLLKTVLMKYDALFGFSLPYMMGIHQRPTDGGDHDGYHLHVEFLPPNRTADKLKYLAGSETSAGAWITDTVPEETAIQLRDLEPRDPAAIPG